MTTSSTLLPALHIISNQEEADTRRVLHACASAKYRCKGNNILEPWHRCYFTSVTPLTQNQHRGIFPDWKRKTIHYSHQLYSCPHSVQLSIQASTQFTSPTLLYDWLWYIQWLFWQRRKKGFKRLMKDAA